MATKTRETKSTDTAVSTTQVTDEQRAKAKADGLSTFAAVKTIPKRLKKHNLVVISAGIAFYLVLALVPTLIAAISMYSLVTDPEVVGEQITSLTEGLEDRDTAELLKTQIENIVADSKSSGGVAFAVGLLLALFSASGAVAKLMATITLSYEATEERKGWKVRLVAAILTIGAIVGLGVLGFLLGAVPNLVGQVLDVSGVVATLISIASALLAALAMMFGLTVVYRHAPYRRPRTPWVNPGAIVATIAALLFVLLFNIYFQFAGGMPPSYGILGSIAALIIFLQLMTVAVLMGAEVNAVVEESRAEQLAIASGEPTAAELKLIEGGAAPGAGKPAEPIPLGKALAGFAALIALGGGKGE